MSRVEQIKKFKLLPSDWEPGGDELTPTMKLKRKPIDEKYDERDRGALRQVSGGRDSFETAVAVVAATMERFNARDFDGFYELIDDDIVCITDPSWPDGGEFAGGEAFRRFFTGFTEAFESVRFEPLSEPKSIGDLVLVDARWVGRGRVRQFLEPGERFTVVSATRAGRLVEVRYYFDTDQAHQYARDAAQAATTRAPRWRSCAAPGGSPITPATATPGSGSPRSAGRAAGRAATRTSRDSAVRPGS